MFHAIHTARGPLAKTPALDAGARTMHRFSKPNTLVKNPLRGDLRIGLKEGLVEEGRLPARFGKPAARGAPGQSPGR